MNKYFLVFIIFSLAFMTSKPVAAERNEKLFERYKQDLKEEEEVFSYAPKVRFVFDEKGNLYLRYTTSNELTLLDAPGPQNGELTLRIPDMAEIDGKVYPVTSVGHDTDEWCGEQIFFPGKGYKKIIYGKNVKSINNMTHYYNQTLEEVEFLGKNIVIGKCAFLECTRLNKVYGSEKIAKIGGGGFSDTAIQTLDLSKTCKKIEASAFYGCKKLKEIPDISNISVIEQSTFAVCTSLKKVVIPEGIKEIQTDAFSACTNLQQVYIPASVKSIGSQVFYGCLKLKGNLTIDSKNRHFTAKDNMILNRKGTRLEHIINEKKVVVIPSYVKTIGKYWWNGETNDDWWLQPDSDKEPKDIMQVLVIQNKNIHFSENSIPSKYLRSKRIKILYPDTRKAYDIKKKHIEKKGRKNKGTQYIQRPYTLHPAPTRVKAKLKKGKVQVSFKKLKNSAVKKYKITYRIKKNGIYQAQKEKVVKGKRATLCSLKKGEICEVRVSAYTKQSGVWLPGKFSRMVKVRRK